MPIPDFQSLMLPLLELVSDGKDHLMKDVTQGLADHFALTEDERRELLPSGQQKIINNRVAWAKAHMKMAGLLENPTRGYIQISQKGRDLLATKPEKINLRTLPQYPSYLEFVNKTPADPAEGNNQTKLLNRPCITFGINHRFHYYGSSITSATVLLDRS